MPQNIHYRTPQPVANPDEALLGMDKMVVMDPRPPRPNSIELRRNYPEENSGGGIYSPRHVQSPNPAEMHYRWVILVGWTFFRQS